MKAGKTLVELAQELQRIKEQARDFVVPVEKLEMDTDAEITFENGSTHNLKPNRHAHSQIGQYTDIPKAYYDRLLAENKELLSRNVNHGLAKKAQIARKDKKPEARMVRTIGSDIRAILSSSYRRLDSFDMCNEILPVLLEHDLQVTSAEITDTRLYIKALSPRLKTEVKKGDEVQYGLVISNSDVGAGSVRVEPLVYRLVCANGMISETAIRKFHVGRNQAESDIYEVLTDETKALSDAAFWAQVKDVTLSSLQEEVFQRQVDRLRIAANEEIKNYDIPRVIELAMASTKVSGEEVKNNMIAYLANGADGAGLTRWGLVNAFTAAAQLDSVSYDQSIELERAGAKVLDLKAGEWSRISAVSQ